MSLAARRMALMEANANSNLLFDWDYTDGIDGKIDTVGTVLPIMEKDGLLLSGEASAYTTSSIVPNISPIVGSYRTVITYSELSVPDKFGGLFFCHYNEEKPRVSFGYMKREPVTGNFTNANGKSVRDLYVPSTDGQMVIEYDAATDTIAFIQGQNKYQAVLSDPVASAAFPRLVYIQTGNGTNPSTVKIQHITIERMGE